MDDDLGLDGEVEGMAVDAAGSAPAAAAVAAAPGAGAGAGSVSFVGAPFPAPVVSEAGTAAAMEAAAGGAAGAGEGVEASLASSAFSANALNGNENDCISLRCVALRGNEKTCSPPTLGFSPRPSSRTDATDASSQTGHRGRGRAGS